MPTLARAPDLVTGSNRSGTTWVGHRLCLSRDVADVREPFPVSVVVMGRGPRAFTGTTKRLDWGFDFAQSTALPLLMWDHLGPVELTSAVVRRLGISARGWP